MCSSHPPQLQWHPCLQDTIGNCTAVEEERFRGTPTGQKNPQGEAGLDTHTVGLLFVCLGYHSLLAFVKTECASARVTASAAPSFSWTRSSLPSFAWLLPVPLESPSCHFPALSLASLSFFNMFLSGALSPVQTMWICFLVPSVSGAEAEGWQQHVTLHCLTPGVLLETRRRFYIN